jgi:hypothetical protein
VAIYPGAVFKPTDFGGRTPRAEQGRGILHVAVSERRSLPPFNGNTWHFYVAKDGYCEQYVDTAFRAFADVEANDDAIAIETQGGTGSSAQVESELWTPAQEERLADIMRWARAVHGVPLELLLDSRPGRRGWGPHRLGIQHSRGVGAVPGWLQPGGERWSTVVGKLCPGAAKVGQIPRQGGRWRGLTASVRATGAAAGGDPRRSAATRLGPAARALLRQHPWPGPQPRRLPRPRAAVRAEHPAVADLARVRRRGAVSGLQPLGLGRRDLGGGDRPGDDRVPPPLLPGPAVPGAVLGR